MLRIRASPLSYQRLRTLSSLAHQLSLDIHEENQELAEVLFPASKSTKLHSRSPTPADDAFLYDASYDVAIQRQLQLEEETVQTAVERYTRLSESARARGDVGGYRPAAIVVGSWLSPVTIAIQKAQEAAPASKSGRKSVEHGGDHLLKLLRPEVLATITIQEVFRALLRDAEGEKLTTLAFNVADAVRGEVNAGRLHELTLEQRRMEKAGMAHGADGEGPLDSTGGILPSPRGDIAYKKPMNNALFRALKSSTNVVSAVNYAAVRSGIEGAAWSARDSVLLGTRLIDILINSTFVRSPETSELVPAFRHYRRYVKKNNVVGAIRFQDATLKLLAEYDAKVGSFVDPKHQPMVVPPRPWISPQSGGYLKTKVELIRLRQSHAFKNALATAEMQPLYDGLNALGETAWCVNRRVLDAGLKLWENGGNAAGLVSRTDVSVPTKPAFLAQAKSEHLEKSADSDQCPADTIPVFDEKTALRRLKCARRAARKINRELLSQRANTQYRLDHAKSFAAVDRFFLPHNVDFRGRAYPIPVYLQHMGEDLTRAMLTFSNPGVRLGERGVYWLKIHLANLLGADKLSFDDRIDVAENSLSRAIAAARNPLHDSNLEWLSGHEDPFQLLAACHEISDAVGLHGGEQTMQDFHSTLPISMDGSCNGLQHYAALGRDLLGGEQVNLMRNDRPQDVYTGVAKFVAKKVDEEAAKGNAVAILLQGKVGRKIVKQTVMTSVYGVTLTGAREQIGNRLRDIKFPEDKTFEASLMLAKMTLSSLGDIFAGASRTMDWLSNCAQKISKDGYEVEWVTPVGLPVIQPYRKRSVSIVKTIMQRVSLERHGDDMPVSSIRQQSAFPPNYVHSIDSSHMLFTAVECQKAGLNFAAVHDSFWTNAGTVDEMNSVLREEFVKLHSRELLSELREGFIMRFPNMKFPDVPSRGSLGLKEVLDSPYFFS